MIARRPARGRDEADHIARLISCSRRLIWSAAARRLEAQGESMLAWQLLNRLRCEGPMTQRDLAFVMGQHAAGISRVLSGLEAEGHVRRKRDPNDRRKQRVELTAKAYRRLAAVDPEIVATAREVLAPLSAAERLSLRTLLGKLLRLNEPSRRR